MKDLRDQLTVFVATVGDEPNFTHAIQCLDRQTVRFQLDVIAGVAPLHEALNQMRQRCKTPYYVQVDEDMMLFPHAVERLFDRMTASPDRVAILAAPLWDCDTEMPIHGVKIYRHGIVARFPYQNSFSCEITQMDRLREAGFETVELPLAPWSCLGEHGKYYSPGTIFERWRRLVHKQRRSDKLIWVESWPSKLAERYRRTGSQLHLWALLGAVSGVTGELPPEGEQDFRAQRVEFERLERYFQADANRETWQPSWSTRVMGRFLRLLSWLRPG